MNDRTPSFLGTSCTRVCGLYGIRPMWTRRQGVALHHHPGEGPRITP